MDHFRIYIFDESHKYVVEEWPEFDDFLENEVDYIQVRDMEEVKEDLLNRKFYGGISDYGIMSLYRRQWSCSRNIIELQYRLRWLFVLYRSAAWCIFNNRRLSIEQCKIIYLGFINEDDIKENLLYRGLDNRAYVILGEDIKIKNKFEGYKNYKVVTRKEIEDRMTDILRDRYDI